VHYSEAITGAAQPPQLEQLSSSVPTVALLAPVAVIGALAAVVNKFLDAWEKIERIRKIRADLTEMGIVKKAAIDELTEEITTTVDRVVEESTELVLANYRGEDGRKSELANGIQQDTRRLFGQIERGLSVEFRAKEDGHEDGDANQKILQDIDNLSLHMKFPDIAKEPMLLGTGEVLEGEIRAAEQSKKTTTHKTTVSKRIIRKGRTIATGEEEV